MISDRKMSATCNGPEGYRIRLSVLPIRIRSHIRVGVLYPQSSVLRAVSLVLCPFVYICLKCWCRHRRWLMTALTGKLCLAAFCGTHLVHCPVWPGTAHGSHAYLMPAIVGHRKTPGISSIFRQVVGLFPAAAATELELELQLQLQLLYSSSTYAIARLGTDQHTKIRTYIIFEYTEKFLAASDWGCFWLLAGCSARFALKPLCGDAKTSSQVKNYCHSLKWSHLTLAALTPSIWGGSAMNYGPCQINEGIPFQSPMSDICCHGAYV